MPIIEPIFMVCPLKTVNRNSKNKSNFKPKTNNTRLIKIIRSMAPSRIIVPKSLSTGTSSVWLRLEQRVIYPALGTAILVK